MPTSRGTTVAVALAAAVLIPRIQKWTGVKLDVDDVAALMALGLTVWHGAAATFERYFPVPKGDSKSD